MLNWRIWAEALNLCIAVLLFGRLVCSLSTIAGLEIKLAFADTLTLLLVATMGFFEKSFEALYDETYFGVMLLPYV